MATNGLGPHNNIKDDFMATHTVSDGSSTGTEDLAALSAEDTVVTRGPLVEYAVGCGDEGRMAAALQFHRPEIEERYRRAAGGPIWQAGPFGTAGRDVLLTVSADTRFDLLEGVFVDIALSYSLDLRPPFWVMASR